MPSLSTPATTTTTATASEPAKRARRKGARPGELLAAALDLFVEKGFAATRVEEVAQRAGVSKGTLFLYFASKEELFKAVVRENISGHFPAWQATLDSSTVSTAELLHASVQAWWETVGNTRASGISKLMMSEASNFPELAAFYQQEVIEPGNALFARLLRRGVSRGEFRPMDMRYATFSMLAPMMFLVIWKHGLGSQANQPLALVPKDFLAIQIDILLNGLCTRANTAASPTQTQTQP